MEYKAFFINFKGLSIVRNCLTPESGPLKYGIGNLYIVCTPFRSAGGWVSLQPNFQKGGGLTGPQFLEWGCWVRGGDFFQERGGLQFSHKK